MEQFKASLILYPRNSGTARSLEALVDTGAGYTVVPRSILESLRCQPVLMGPPGGHVLLGVTTLEELGLGIDPLNRRLTPADLYLA